MFMRESKDLIEMKNSGTACSFHFPKEDTTSYVISYGVFILLKFQHFEMITFHCFEYLEDINTTRYHSNG